LSVIQRKCARAFNQVSVDQLIIIIIIIYYSQLAAHDYIKYIQNIQLHKELNIPHENTNYTE